MCDGVRYCCLCEVCHGLATYTVDMKTCCLCKKNLSVSEFYRDPTGRRKDGLCPRCKQCHSTVSKSSPNRQAVQRRYQTSIRGRTRHAANARAYRRLHKDKVSARARVQYAREIRELDDPARLQCSCGRPAIEYHHHNGYGESHWTDVIPICRRCHTRV